MNSVPIGLSEPCFSTTSQCWFTWTCEPSSSWTWTFGAGRFCRCRSWLSGVSDITRGDPFCHSWHPRWLRHPESLSQSMKLCLQLLPWPLRHHQLHHLLWTPSLLPSRTSHPRRLQSPPKASGTTGDHVTTDYGVMALAQSATDQKQLSSLKQIHLVNMVPDPTLKMLALDFQPLISRTWILLSCLLVGGLMMAIWSCRTRPKTTGSSSPAVWSDTMWCQEKRVLILPKFLHKNKLTCQFLLASWMMFELRFVVVKMVSSTFVTHPKMLLKFLTNHGLAAFFRSMAMRAVSLVRRPILIALRSRWANSRRYTPNESLRKIRTRMTCQKGTWAWKKSCCLKRQKWMSCNHFLFMERGHFRPLVTPIRSAP